VKLSIPVLDGDLDIVLYGLIVIVFLGLSTKLTRILLFSSASSGL